MTDHPPFALLLRFRDLVTEPGGNIAEHRRIIRHRGYAWWGWWARQHEIVPRAVFAAAFSDTSRAAELLLFDTGMMRLYRTTSRRAVVAPSHLGVNSPDFEATPDYYVRGRYPAWFRLEEDIVPLDTGAPNVLARPTLDDSALLDPSLPGEEVTLDSLRDERPTLWVVRATDSE